LKRYQEFGWHRREILLPMGQQLSETSNEETVLDGHGERISMRHESIELIDRSGMKFSREVHAKSSHLLEFGLEMADEQEFESSLDGLDFMLAVRWKNEKKRLGVVRFELIEYVSVRVVVIAVVIDGSIGSTGVG
jgi:hypothetical protein